MGIRSNGSAIPAGTEAAYHGGTVPPGWLLMYGQVVAIADYPRLFSVLGTRYGGDGVATFGIPDSRGRATIGRDDMGGTTANRVTTAGSGLDGATLGAVGGGESVTLAEAQMPAHTHNNSGGASTSGSFGYNAGNGNFVTTASKGGGGAHRTVQPSIVANKMIKT